VIEAVLTHIGVLTRGLPTEQTEKAPTDTPERVLAELATGVPWQATEEALGDLQRLVPVYE
jgi:hypothetical protein